MKNKCIHLLSGALTMLFLGFALFSTAQSSNFPAPINGTDGQHPTGGGQELYTTVGGTMVYSWDYNFGASDYSMFNTLAPGVTSSITPYTGISVGNAGEMVYGDPTKFYSIDMDGAAWLIDITLGTETSLGTVTGILGYNVLGMALDYTNGNYYLCDDYDNLYTINMTTLVATLVGNFGTSSGFMIGITCDGSGNLWGHDLNFDLIYSINKTTGVATVVGPTGFDANYAQGMGWDPDLGMVVLTAFNNTTFQAEYRSVNTSTGATTFLGVIGTTGGVTEYGSCCIPVSVNACGGMTVYLKDSNGNLLSGGSLTYQDGGWQTATEISTGVFCVTTVKPNIKLRMVYAEAELFETVPSNTDYTFQTVLVTFELRKRTGLLGYNFGQIYYVGFGGLLATTGQAGLGLAQKELLPREYTFRMKFRGGRGDITQDITVNPVVTWEMARMLVQLNKSDGHRGLNGADIKYKGYSLEQFGVTGTSENGRARKDLLPGFYKFTIKYLGGSMVVDNFQVVQGDNELIIDGLAVTVELEDSNTGLPVDGGKATNIGVTGNLMGYTGDSGPGIVTVDLLPLVYSFDMTFNGDSETKNGIDVTSTPWITFYTDDLKSSLVSSDETNSMVAYPNPFVNNTTVGFSLEKGQHVTVNIYDLTGKHIANLYDGPMSVGTHKMLWESEHLMNGIYVCKIVAENGTYEKLLIKQ